MNYIITPERQAYLDARGYTILMACPGSGKTTSIVYKLKQLSLELENSTKGYGGLACLSFTNAACDEYRKKYRDLHGESITYPHIVSTIDSFITQNIVLPFGHFVGLNGHIQIENDDDVLEELYHTHYTDANGKEQTSFIKEIRIFGHQMLKKARSKYEYDSDGYYWNGHKVNDPNEIKYAEACISHRIKCGVLKSQDALSIAHKILQEYQEITYALIQRFPYIIVDEAQDTSKTQMDIFAILKNNGLLNLEFVGDLAQSIYTWRNARPEILKQLSNNGEFNVLPLLENRRSTQRIINFYELVKDKSIPHAISTGVFDEGRDIVVYRYNKGMERNILLSFKKHCEDYNLHSKLILARGNSEVNLLSGTNNEIELWKSKVPYQLIRASQAKEKGEFSESINALRRVWCDCIFKPSQFKEKQEFKESIVNDVEKNALLLSILEDLPSLDMSFQKWEEATTTLIQKKLSLITIPDFQQKKSVKGHKKAELLLESVNKYFGRGSDAKLFGDQIMTIHNAKGASVDAVLLFLSEKHNNNTISLADFPDFGQTIAGMSESQRLIYVACSRPKQFLAIAIPSVITEAQIRQKLGMAVKIFTIN